MRCQYRTRQAVWSELLPLEHSWGTSLPSLFIWGFSSICGDLWKDLMKGIKCFSPCEQFFIPLISYDFYKLQDGGAFMLLAAYVSFRGMLRRCFPGCPGIWRGVSWHLRRNIFTQDSLAIWIFFKNVWFWDSTYSVLHQGRCPSLRHSKRECSRQRSIKTSHEGWFLKPEELF